MTFASNSVAVWRSSLTRLLRFYYDYRRNTRFFFLQLFLFFVVINVVCYWMAMYTAFSDLLESQYDYYFKIQYPVGVMGAMFDSLSFFVTIFIIGRALKTRRTSHYVGHLSIDFLIAILATCWVVFVFIVSGWIVTSLDSSPPQVLQDRVEVYEEIVVSAVKAPTENLRNIYFGFIMGVSAMIPTTTHILMYFRALYKGILQGSRHATHGRSNRGRDTT